MSCHETTSWRKKVGDLVIAIYGFLSFRSTQPYLPAIPMVQASNALWGMGSSLTEWFDIFSASSPCFIKQNQESVTASFISPQAKELIWERLPPSSTSLAQDILWPFPSCYVRLLPQGFHLSEFPEINCALMHSISINCTASMLMSPLTSKEEEGTHGCLPG